jgi:hypothetical protein
MNQSLTNEASTSDSDKSDHILSGLEQLQKDLHLAKCEIKTAIRDVALHQGDLDNSLVKLRVAFSEIDARLHGIELHLQRQNSST